mmetsp:Transcript_318/g.930  ORF Transcript_318/g.930 Transcript_318/m.930 type:complete len:99 (+) Transcript_318:1428-1724(+)
MNEHQTRAVAARIVKRCVAKNFLGIEVRAILNQELANFVVLPPCCTVQRRISCQVAVVDIRSSMKQISGNLLSASAASFMKRGTLCPMFIDREAAFDQ